MKPPVSQQPRAMKSPVFQQPHQNPVVAFLNRRVADLLAANNRYLDDRRAAQRRASDAILLASRVGVPDAALTPAALDVFGERRRQVEVGWTPEHDDAHADQGTALWARLFPWKPSQNRRDDLVKAGALILAEIERIDRAEERAADTAQRLAALPEEGIDTTDIPEAGPAFFEQATLKPPLWSSWDGLEAPARAQQDASSGMLRFPPGRHRHGYPDRDLYVVEERRDGSTRLVTRLGLADVAARQAIEGVDVE